MGVAQRKPQLRLISDQDDWDLALAYFEEYQRSAGLAETTIRNRASFVRTLRRSCGKSYEEVTLVDLRRHLGRPGITAGTRRTERGALVAFFRFLLEDDFRGDDPTVRLAPVTAPKGTPRPFTRAQIDAMLDSGAYRKTRAMILLGYFQGFRVSQIGAVHGGDIDRLTSTIRTVGKGNKERRLPLHPVIAELATTMPADDWWFPARGTRTGHVRGSSVTDLITKAKIRAGITDPKLTPHSLRHAYGTDLVEAEVDIRVVQELMMHESLATTQIYTGVSERRKRAAVDALPGRVVPIRSGRSANPLAA
ncbi:tyrosine-type recombinase/integrase [Microbacterium sp. BWR-S6Y]|uniref:tyrosine-type recombinase/integrase n=1 Tax=Microbacterium sp. BWR-S6Y TaxID=3232073 RepID=UPI00352904F5